MVPQARRRAKRPLCRAIVALLNNPDVRPEKQDAGEGVGIHVRARYLHPMHVPDGLDHVFALRLRIPGLTSSEFPDRLVGPEQDMKSTEPGRFLEQAEIGGIEPLQTGGNNYLRYDLRPATRTLIRSEPGTVRGETTVRYPPPQPEYIAPGYFA